MVTQADTASVVDRVCKRAGNSTNRSFTEALRAIEPARLKAVDENLRLFFRNIHDRRNAVREIADGVVARSWKFPVPRNRIRCHLKTLNERAMHIGFADERVHDQSDVVAIDGSQEPPVASPRVHFDLDETGTDRHVPLFSITPAAASTLRSYGSLVRRDEARERGPLLWIFRRRDDAVL